MIYRDFSFLILLVFSTLLLCTFLLIPQSAKSESVSSTVIVGNTAPVFDGNPAENPESDTTTPTNVGTDVTFIATAIDSNGEEYYLAVCKTNSITAVDGGPPTCGGGEWCVSGTTSSNTQATCNYNVDVTDTEESYAWYAFVCDDHSSGSLCSSVSQGTGDSGSPFAVNHSPIFNAISNDSAKNPGQSVTWNTDASTTDSDIDGDDDTIKLLVCTTAGVTNGACDGTELCSSLFVANDPSCSYLIPVPTADGVYDAFVHIIDNHEFESTDPLQESNSQYTVSNVSPVVSNVSINGGTDIDLAESTTEPVIVTADVADNNGCVITEITGVESSLYRSGVTYANCDTIGDSDYDSCYPVLACSQSSCAGASATYSCTFDLKYHADPTDANTQYPLETWFSTVVATDDDLAEGSDEDDTGVDVNSLTAMDITPEIDYGSLSVGTNTGNLNQTTTITATGNVGLDELLSGTDMDDGDSHVITVNYQKYDTSAVLYSAATSLSAVDTEAELNVAKTKSIGLSTVPEFEDTWWGIEIPPGTVSGVYNGTNTVTAVKGETVNW